MTLAPGDVPISTPPRIAVDISGPGRGENTLIGKPAGVDVGVVGKILEQGWGAVSDPPMGKHGLEGGEGGVRTRLRRVGGERNVGMEVGGRDGKLRAKASDVVVPITPMLGRRSDTPLGGV